MVQSYAVGPDLYVGNVLDLVDSKGYQFRSFPVVDVGGRLVGMLADALFVPDTKARRSLKQIPRAEVFTSSSLSYNPTIVIADKF